MYHRCVTQLSNSRPKFKMNRRILLVIHRAAVKYVGALGPKLVGSP